MTPAPASTGIFDAEHPPSRALADACVHCGFCLPTCPTYVLWGEEMDSPRGRIHLMKAGLDGRVAMDECFVAHVDTCLGCLACVTACPSGVDYASLVEATRAQIERRWARSWSARAMRAGVYGLVTRPGLLRAVLMAAMPLLAARRLADWLGLMRHLPDTLRALGEIAPAVSLRSLVSSVPATTVARGERRLRVGILTGCVQRVLFGDVNAATVAVLAAEGCEVAAPPQGCCGALELHGGRDRAARVRAKRIIATFEAAGVDRVVVNVAGCGSTMKGYGRLLAEEDGWADRASRFAAAVRDVSELMAEIGAPRAARHPVAATVAYHDACHLGHAQGIRHAPREMLACIPRLEVVDLPEGDLCCGSAGVFNIFNPEPAMRLGARTAAHIATVDPDLVATGNAGCLLQLRGAQRGVGRAVRIVHPIQLVEASIAGRSAAEIVRP